MTQRCRCQSIGSVVDPLPPPPSSLIPWTCCLSSADASGVVVKLFVLILLCRRLRRRFRFLGAVVNPPPPPPLSPIPRARRLFLILCQRLCRRFLFLWPVFLRQHHRCRRQLPGSVNTLTPPPSEMFTRAHCIFYFLLRRLRWCRQFLELIFLCRRLRRCRQFLRPVIATPHPPSSSPNPCRLCRYLRSLESVVYSLSSADTSVVVAESSSPSSSNNAVDVVVNSLDP